MPDSRESYFLGGRPLTKSFFMHLLFILVVLSSGVLASAEDYCVPQQDCISYIDSFDFQCASGYQQNQYSASAYFDWLNCEEVPQYRQRCTQGQSYLLAKDVFTQELFGEVYYYADIEDIVACEFSCENNACTGSVPRPDCTNGYQQCVSSLLGGSYVQECVNGEWVQQESCDSSCVEQSSTRAYCEFQQYICYSSVTGECDYWSDTKSSNCYDTQTQCENSKEVCCINSELNVFRVSNSCSDGETEHWNSNTGDLTFTQWCENRLDVIVNQDCSFLDFECHGAKITNALSGALFWLLIGLGVVIFLYYSPFLLPFVIKLIVNIFTAVFNVIRIIIP